MDMVEAEHHGAVEAAEGGPLKHEIFIYFVSGKEYETHHASLTGLQIKAKVPDWDPSHDLVLEGHGDHPDRVIRDDESVHFNNHEAPRRFSSVPKANFGC